MKILVLLVFWFVSISVKSQDAYRVYLLSKVWQISQLHTALPVTPTSTNPVYFIPRYEIPKGNVFCRLEDKLNRTTKVWIKIGVK